VLTDGWGAPVRDAARVRRLAWEGRDRLSLRDRTLLEAYVGPRYPEPSYAADLLAARERAVAQYGDVADAWYFLGDEYSTGRYLGYADWAARARAAFERAVGLDSSFAGPLSHLINIAAWRSDTARARRYGRLFTSGAARTGLFDHLVRWDLARTLGDRALMREFWTVYDTAPNRPEYLAGYALQTGGPLATVDSALDILARRASTDNARGTYHYFRGLRLFNSGRPTAALRQLDSAAGALPEEAVQRSRLMAATYFDADSAIGAAAAARLSELGAGPLPDSGPPRAMRLASACALAQGRLARGDAGAAAAAAARRRAARPAPGDPARLARNTHCGVLEAPHPTDARCAPGPCRLDHAPGAAGDRRRLDAAVREPPRRAAVRFARRSRARSRRGGGWAIRQR
jgi:hypothetical protein